MAGTRPRGQTPEEDDKLEIELLNDPKELAEHLMLIDLGRNDIGKICTTGSVEVTEKMTVERFSHVMHISSNVEGLLRKDRNAFDILRATLPVGTLSGAKNSCHRDYRRTGAIDTRNLWRCSRLYLMER